MFFSVVQMGAPPGHGNENKTGWAWIDTQPGQHLQILEAYRLAELVGNTLRLQVCLPGSPSRVQSRVMPQVRCLPKPCDPSPTTYAALILELLLGQSVHYLKNA